MKVIEEVELAVENLNADLFTDLESLPDYEEGSLEFTFRSDGNTIIVEFLRFDLWNSESDERDEYCSQCKRKNYEKSNEDPQDATSVILSCCIKHSEYEPIENFVRREANKMLKMLENLHFMETDSKYEHSRL